MMHACERAEPDFKRRELGHARMLLIVVKELPTKDEQSNI
jgi:hypothetical protein